MMIWWIAYTINYLDSKWCLSSQHFLNPKLIPNGIDGVIQESKVLTDLMAIKIIRESKYRLFKQLLATVLKSTKIWGWENKKWAGTSRDVDI